LIQYGRTRTNSLKQNSFTWPFRLPRASFQGS
jgi:hypothetical protein